MRLATPLMIALSLASAPLSHADDLKAETPDQQALYALGGRIARDFQTLGVTAEELAYLKAGMDDLYSGKTEIDLQDRAAIENIQRFQRSRFQASLDREKAEGKKFLDKAAGTKGAEKTESGLVYIRQEAGKGDSPGPDDTVKVTYKGSLRDGKVFDSQLDPDKAASFPLSGVISCWKEALQRLTPGGKALFYCPSEMAYGDNGFPPNIPPGASLQFEVQLLEVQKKAAE